MHLSKTVDLNNPRVNPNVNYDLWVIMMWQCRFINYKKNTILVGDVNDEEG